MKKQVMSGHVARMAARKNVYSVDGKTGGKELLGRPRRR
jgi:hypothetical protein